MDVQNIQQVSHYMKIFSPCSFPGKVPENHWKVWVPGLTLGAIHHTEWRLPAQDPLMYHDLHHWLSFTSVLYHQGQNVENWISQHYHPMSVTFSYLFISYSFLKVCCPLFLSPWLACDCCCCTAIFNQSVNKLSYFFFYCLPAVFLYMKKSTWRDLSTVFE